MVLSMFWIGAPKSENTITACAFLTSSCMVNS
ncbi:Uncharacterised protein [Vibrio cholerae]|nr:Uncharacterised protein [Vibrio cholerae]CSI56829.1 Uncharacterised protein [Vibrio cholerae]